MSRCLKKLRRLIGLSVIACAFLLLSAPQSVSIADDDIKALERKLELLKKKASRKNVSPLVAVRSDPDPD